MYDCQFLPGMSGQGVEIEMKIKRYKESVDIHLTATERRHLIYWFSTTAGDTARLTIEDKLFRKLTDKMACFLDTEYTKSEIRRKKAQVCSDITCIQNNQDVKKGRCEAYQHVYADCKSTYKGKAKYVCQISTPRQTIIPR